MSRPLLNIRYHLEPFDASFEFSSDLLPINLNRYWHGAEAPSSRSSRVYTRWNSEHLEFIFSYQVFEPLVVGHDPDLAKKTVGLWERDVCEVFIAPDKNEPRKYFEFEVAPTGEWLDMSIDMTSGERVTDWDYNSGMEVAARIEEGRVTMAVKIPWEAFGKRPKAGDVWLGNLFRCVGKGKTRGYLAWQPTGTKEPNFHVPSKFGEFEFIGKRD